MSFDEKSFARLQFRFRRSFDWELQLVMAENNRNYSTEIDKFFVSFHCFLSILPAFFVNIELVSIVWFENTAASVRCVIRKHLIVIVCLTTVQDSPTGNENLATH
jgi:hypothetical protein